MNISSFLKTVIDASLLTVIILGTVGLTSAQVRSSASYQLQSDSVNFGGGLSTSTNYSLESTAGEVATGDSDSSTYSLRAGYQQMQEVFLSMTGFADVVMTPNLGGLTGGVSNGSTSVSVLTDSPSGYELTIRAASAPAMVGEFGSIDDYVPAANPNADYGFVFAGGEAVFGFSPEGTDVVSRYLNNTSVCGTGSTSSALVCWDGLSTTDVPIAQGTANQPAGATTTIHFRVGIGSGAGVIAGTYIATTTITAAPL
jgi:hypothetical protein